MFLAHRPSLQEIARFLDASQRLPLSYEPSGLAQTGGAGFRTHEEVTTVAVAIAHLGFWSLNGCRVVYSTREAGGSTFGFAYGTLPNHAECGEEIFEVRLDPHTGDVSYRIRAVSRPRAAMAKLGRDSALAVRRAIEGR